MQKCHVVWAALAMSVVAYCSVQAAELKPFQKAAVDRVLATMEPSMRDMVRPQLEQTFGAMDESQINMMLANMGENEAANDAPAEEEEPAQASPADLAHNRAQYEPAIRKAWAAQKAFDDYVDAKLAAQCPKQGTYAVWGQAWRYEVMPVNPNWPRASQNADLEVQIIGSSYAPQDGRYQFDFSDVRTTFERGAVDAAIAKACTAYKAVGQGFMTAAKAGMSGDVLPNGVAIENAANNKASAINQELEGVLQQKSPAGNGALYQALINGERIN